MTRTTSNTLLAVGLITALVLLKLLKHLGVTWGEIAPYILPVGLTFGILAGIVAGIVAYRKWQKSEALLKTSHPDQPWLWKKDWATGRIKCMSTTALWVVGLFAFLWNAISSPILIVGRDQVFDPNNRGALLALLFPAVGLLMIFFWLLLLVRHRKFGDSYFQMASVPGVIGGKLAGAVFVGRHIQPPAGFTVTLTCLRTITTGSGDNTSTSKEVLHQEEMVVTRELQGKDNTRTAIPILFGLPYDALPTGARGPRESIDWVLAVNAKLQGPDYDVQFDVPVFMTEESSPDFRLDTSAFAWHVAELNTDDQLKGQKILHTTTPDKETFFSPMFRAPGSAIGLSLMGAAWFGIVVVLFKSSAPVALGIVFALFGLILWYWMLDLLVWSARVEIMRNGIRIAYGMFRLNRCELPHGAVTDVRVERGLQSGNTLLYSVVMTVTGGKKQKVQVGKHIRNRKVAETLVDLYQGALAAGGSRYVSGEEFRHDGQRWVLGQKVLTQTLLLGLIVFLVNLSVDIRTVMWRHAFPKIVSELKAANPGMKKTLIRYEAGVLNISGDRSITTIESLRGRPLHSLDMGDTGVTNISAIEGMALTGLTLWATPVTDITAVKGMPLTYLSIGHCPVPDISMLKGMRLKFLSMTRTRVTDISVLSGMPLEELDLNGSLVPDIGPLKGAPLKVLLMNDVNVKDISALEGMSLTKLWMVNTPVSDISVLRGMPLKELWIQRSAVRDVAPLASCRKLEYLLLDPGCKGLEKLKGLPNLKLIGYERGQEKPPAAFWKELEQTGR